MIQSLIQVVVINRSNVVRSANEQIFSKKNSPTEMVSKPVCGKIAATSINNCIKFVFYLPYFLGFGLTAWCIYIFYVNMGVTDASLCQAKTITYIILADGIVIAVCIILNFLALVISAICLYFSVYF